MVGTFFTTSGQDNITKQARALAVTHFSIFASIVDLPGQLGSAVHFAETKSNMRLWLLSHYGSAWAMHFPVALSRSISPGHSGILVCDTHWLPTGTRSRSGPHDGPCFATHFLAA